MFCVMNLYNTTAEFFLNLVLFFLGYTKISKFQLVSMNLLVTSPF